MLPQVWYRALRYGHLQTFGVCSSIFQREIVLSALKYLILATHGVMSKAKLGYIFIN